MMLALKLRSFAEQEQMRADDLARKVFEITGDPDHQMRASLDLFQFAYRLACEAAAARTVQPRRWRRWTR